MEDETVNSSTDHPSFPAESSNLTVENNRRPVPDLPDVAALDAGRMCVRYSALLDRDPEVDAATPDELDPLQVSEIRIYSLNCTQARRITDAFRLGRCYKCGWGRRGGKMKQNNRPCLKLNENNFFKYLLEIAARNRTHDDAQYGDTGAHHGQSV